MYLYVLFDFDGTLADSSQCAVIATQSAFEQMNLPVPSVEQITQAMGVPIEVSFRQMGAACFDECRFNELLAVFREIYRNQSAHHIKGFASMNDALRTLKNQGKKIAIVTSKKSDVAIKNIKQLGIMAYIDVVVGSDKVAKPKPDPECVLTALGLLGVPPSEYAHAIMIGDATFDIDAGKSAGVASCAVAWGSHSVEQLAGSQPDYLVYDFDELLGVLGANIGQGAG